MFLLVAFAPIFSRAQMCFWEEDYMPEEFATIPNVCITDRIVGDNRIAFEADISTGELLTEVFYTVERTGCIGCIEDSIIYTGPIINTDNDIYHLHVALEDYGAISGNGYRLNIIAVNDAGDDTAVFNYACPTASTPDVSISFNEDCDSACYWEIELEMEANFDETRFKYIVYTEFADTVAFGVFNSSPEYQEDVQILINAEEYMDLQLFAKIAGKNSFGADYDYVPFNFFYDDEGGCHMAVWREGIENDKGKVKIYPNPATDYIKIVGEWKIVEIDNLSGETVYIGSYSETVDISSQPTGLYIASIFMTDGTIRTEKIIKQ